MKKKWIILSIILGLLVVFFIMLPSIVTRYVNRVLADIPGYTGSVSDVDMHLYRGAYKIHDLKIFKVEGNREIPFVDIPSTDLSIEWSALFDGEIVGEIKFENPVLNFIAGKEEEGQSGEDVDWTEPIKELMPVRINKLEIVNGAIVFYDFSTEPKVDLRLESLNLTATNLNNAEDEQEALPSSVTATATTIGGGELSLVMKLNPLKVIPDLDLNMELENVNMPALNDFFEAYARVDIEKGNFNLYSEIVVRESQLTGYVKPIAEDVQVVDLEEDKDKPVKLLWETVVSAVGQLFENQPRSQVATQVPLRGDLSQVETAVWPTVWNIFRNAFFEAFTKNTDNSVEFESAATGEKTENKASEKRDNKKDKKNQKDKE